MSTLKTNAIRNITATSDSITLASDGTATAKITNYPRHNLIINGDFRIAQRSSSMVAVSDGSNEDYQSVDRWGFSGNWGSGAVSVGQDSESPAGFSYSYKVDVTTAYAGANGVTVQLYQKIEAQELASCGWDYTSASSYLTLSFWVKSPKTGTHAITLETYDGDSQYRVLTYSVSSANTWEKKSIQIPGGSNVTIDTNNDKGMCVYFMMTTGSDYHNTADAWDSSARFGVTGQVNVLDNTANNFYLTGVQLEAGDTATDFEHRSYNDELLRCFRYLQVFNQDKDNTYYTYGTGPSKNTNTLAIILHLRSPMRTQPSLTVVGSTRGYNYEGYTAQSASGTIAISGNNSDNNTLEVSVETSGTGFNSARQCLWQNENDADAHLLIDAEH
tara:strand:- start:1715 stop:2875 length:1161 start_codon:yes stop_codon:yes gene_type:complete